MLKTTAQLHSPHTLASECSKFSKQDFNSMWIEISRCSAEFRKGRGTRDQNPNICWVIEKARDFQKKTYISFIEHTTAFDHVDDSKLGESLQETGIPEHLICLLRNLYACQEATVRARHGMMGWFQIRKEVCQGCILSPCLFNLKAVYIMWNPGLDKSQARIKITGRNINNLRYADDTTLMFKREDELKSLLMKLKEEREKVGLKLLKKEDHGIQSHQFMVNRKAIHKTVRNFLGLQLHCRWWLQSWN